MNLRKGKEVPFTFPCHWLATSLITLFFSTPVLGQNLVCKSIPTNQPIQLDTVLIEPGSLQTENAYNWNDSSQVIFVRSQQEMVEVCYRVVSELLTREHQQRDISTYDNSSFSRSEKESSQPIEREELFDFGEISRFGAITRGVSFGNRQSLFVNSSLNLQMEGALDENLFVSAVITDQNIPYQPEGNTQQIRDFDNVFIKLYNDQFDVTVGDIVLQEPDNAGYFLRYLKNVQGIQASYLHESEKWTSKSRVSGALSKGKFNSAIVEPVDGLQGPYRLRGPNGERFIIVLANSEKVFLDGKRLERGFDRDYVIDYNLGEITFNNHVVITQFSIIRVDYEYAEQFYGRSNYSASQSIKTGGVEVFANFYQERDDPNNRFGLNLSQQSINLLSSIGDRQDEAFVSAFDSVRFNENRILYEKVDTVDLDGQAQEIFVQSNDAQAELFNPVFSNVGFGNGDYVLTSTTSNGRIYEWVSPQSGEKQGSYVPGVLISLPSKRQMFSLGAAIEISENEIFRSEVAFSDTDRNLFSSVDDMDNQGKAFYASLSSENRPSFIDGYDWTAQVSLEVDEASFTFIDRYRSILFDRDWNFDAIQSEQKTDKIFFFSGGLRKDAANQFVYALNRRLRDVAIDGWQQQLDFNQELMDFKLTSTHFLLDNRQFENNTTWRRSRSDISYQKWKFAPGYIFDLDENEVARQDSVISSLMNYRSSEFYISSTDSSKATYRVSYRLRTDRLPVDGEMKDYLLSRNFNLQYGIVSPNSSLSLDFNFRTVDDRLELGTTQDEIINGRVNWIQSFLNKNLRSSFSYATGNSRVLRREFIYLPVTAGEGTHTWRDLNEDGVQDLNEFFEAVNPDQRNYAKIFTPTDDYLTAFQTFYLHTIDARLPSVWRTGGSLAQVASRLSINLNFNVNFQTTSNDYEDRLSPFFIGLGDESLLSINDIKRYTLFYNRNGRGFATDFTVQNASNKQALVQGFETREKRDYISNAKIDLGSEYTLRLTNSFGNQLSRSNFLDSRNFDIRFSSYRPQLIWQPTAVLRFVGSLERKFKRNTFSEQSQEKVVSQSYTGEATWSQAGKGSLRVEFSFININYEGDPNSYLGYLLLDALQPGKNQTWQINWQQKLSKGMQLSLLYNGRNSVNTGTIHTGSVQLTAYF